MIAGLRHWTTGGGNLAGQDTGREALSHTRLSAFLNCHRRYAFAYEDRLQPIVKADPLSLGGAFQKGIELQNPRAGALTLSKPIYGQEEADRLEVHMLVVEAAGSLYLKRWPADETERREFEYRVRLRNPTGRLSRTFDLHGFADGLVDRGEHWRLIENKLVGQINENAVRKLEIDRQIALECYGIWRATGKPVREVSYRWVRKPSIRRRRDESQAEFCDRLYLDYEERADWYSHEEELIRDDSDLLLIESELWEWAEQVRHARRRAMWTRNTSYCLEHGVCPFLPLCLGDADAGALFEHRTERAVHPAHSDEPLQLALDTAA